MSSDGDSIVMPHDASGGTGYDSRRLVGLVCPFVGAIYAASAALFAYLGVWPLVFAYLACLLFELWVWHATRSRPERFDALLVWTWGVVFAQSLLAVRVLGPEAGFQYYLMATIPVIFSRIHRPLLLKLLQTVLIVVFFLICDSWMMRYAVPLYPLSEPVLAALRHVNIIGVCAVLSVGAHFQARVIGESTAALRRVASTDALTGLLNRRSLREIAERELARCRRSGTPLALLLGDIDYFKRINDVHGHAAGDHVLKLVANLLPAGLRDYDSVARWGGEEFIVLLPDTDLEHALIIAERLRAGVAASHPQFEGEVIPVTMTVGVATWSADDNWHAIVARADEALYRGKRAGRNRVEAA